VNLEGNPLSDVLCMALREITSAPGYSGPIYNSMTRLPESLIHLSSETTVNLEGNPLSDVLCMALREITSAPGYSGPIYNS
ncbi:hypothetical protein V5H32_23430, partial [Salmonella enterica]